MADIYFTDPQKLNIALAEALKEIDTVKAPEWVFFVKTGTAQVRPPADSDFYYKRAASILRQAYKMGVIGVGRLRTKYGGRKDRGARPPEFRKASGKMIRVLLQQLETSGLLEKAEGKKKGRKLSKKGVQFILDAADKAK